MEGERAERARHGSGFKDLLSGKIALLCGIYFLNTVATYGVFLFLPKIMREASGFTGFKLSAITAIPFAVALVGMVLIGRHSDRTGERKRHVAACALTAAVGLVLAAASRESVLLIVLSFALSQLGQRAVQGVFWAIPPLFLGGTAAAAGIAMINAVGNLGGFVGPSLMGWLRKGTESYTAGLLVLAAALTLQAILVLSLRLSGPKPELARPELAPVPAK
jgi:nitrate/nitrite transporter NarK